VLARWGGKKGHGRGSLTLSSEGNCRWLQLQCRDGSIGVMRSHGRQCEPVLTPLDPGCVWAGGQPINESRQVVLANKARLDKALEVRR
jgi:hypothetical protein